MAPAASTTAATARARRAASGTDRSTGLPPLAQAIKIQAEGFRLLTLWMHCHVAMKHGAQCRRRTLTKQVTRPG
jgi:hypothetical protein